MTAAKDIVERLREAAALPTGLYAEAAAAIVALRAERDAARDALSKAADDLAEAAVDIDSWGAYASGYFQEKHDLQGCVADYAKRSEQARAALAAKEKA